jgi:elongation factor Ts
MHIAASAPVCVREEDMPADFVEKERAIIQGQVKEDPKMTGKPQDMIDKIVEGKLKKIYQEQVLLNQKFVKNPDITVGDYLKTTIAALGENMGIRKFSRLMLGEGA